MRCGMPRDPESEEVAISFLGALNCGIFAALTERKRQSRESRQFRELRELQELRESRELQELQELREN